jgi:hypothetical protein
MYLDTATLGSLLETALKRLEMSICTIASYRDRGKSFSKSIKLCHSKIFA